jgi:hypothetical protein
MEKKVIDRKVMTTVLTFSFMITSMILASTVLMGPKTSMNRYFIKGNYNSSGDLFQTLANNPSRIFVWCCDCIRYYALKLGLTYEQLNIHLFVILQPMLILMFFTLFLIQSIKINRMVCRK